MDWYRRYTDRINHPQLFQAGFWGRALFDAICDLSAREDLGGEVPPQYQHPDYWAHIMGLGQADGLAENPTAIIPAALEKLFAVGLLRKESLGEGHGDAWVIDGWERRQPRVPAASTSRVQKHREKLAAKRSGKTVKRDETPMKRDETEGNAKSLSLSLSVSSVSSKGVQGESAAPEPPAPAEQVFEHWRKRMGRNGRTAFDKKRKAAVEARLADGYTVEDLCRAVDGCALTPHNIGQNDNGQRYDDLELICRNAGQVDRFRGNAEKPPIPGRAATGRATPADKDWKNTPIETTETGDLMLVPA